MRRHQIVNTNFSTPVTKNRSLSYNLYIFFEQDKEKLVEALLDPSHNTEKVIYFLLLDRKKRRPCYEDETELGRMRFNAAVVIEFE